MTKTLPISIEPLGRRYFRFKLKQNWQQLVLYIVLILLITVLPAAVMSSRITRAYSFEMSNAVSEIRYILDSVLWCTCVASGLLGVFGGMCAISYVNRKTETTLLHSFALKRETIYVAETLTQLAYYLIALVLSVLGSVALIATVSAANGMGAAFAEAAPAAWILKYALAAILTYLFVMSLFLLAAGLTGTAWMRLIVTAVLAIAPIALLFLICYSFNAGAEWIYEDYYVNALEAVVSPAGRLVCNLSAFLNEHAALAGLWIFLESAFCYLAGLVLHKVRASEKAGVTVIWKPVFAVVKYLAIVIGALTLALFFSTLFGESAVALLAGAVFGAFFAFLVSNCVLYRSTKSMFQGKIGFAIALLLIVLFIFFVPMNVTGLIGRPYSSTNTASIVVPVNGRDIRFDEAEDLQNAQEILKDAVRSRMEPGTTEWNKYYYEQGWSSDRELIEKLYPYYEVTEEEGRFLTPDSMWDFMTDSNYDQMSIVQNPKIGIPLAVQVPVAPGSDARWRALIESEAFAKQFSVADLLNGRVIQDVSIRLPDAQEGWLDENSIRPEEISALAPIMKFDAEHLKHSPIVGMIQIVAADESYSTGSITYPVTAEETELIRELYRIMRKVPKNESGKVALEDIRTADDVVRIQADQYSCVALIDLVSGEIREVPEKEISSLLAGVVCVDGGGYSYDFFSYAGTENYRLLAVEEDNKTGWRFSFREGAFAEGYLEELFGRLPKGTKN